MLNKGITTPSYNNVINIDQDNQHVRMFLIDKHGGINFGSTETPLGNSSIEFGEASTWSLF